MTQERIDAIVETILATKALQNSSWLAWGRNQLTRVGFRRSATSISRLFDDMPEQRHILLAGLDGAGKSTLLRNYFSQDCGRDVLSVGLDTGWWGVEEVSYANVSLYTLDLGCSRPPWYRRLERSIASEMDAVIWVLDASDHDRLCEAKEELQNVVLAGGGLKRAAPVLLLFNKRDLFVSVAVVVVVTVCECMSN